MPLRYRRQVVQVGPHRIRLRTLMDRQQFSDPLGAAAAAGISPASWPIFGVLWPAGRILANLMTTEPIDNRHILEVGCGIGLASLVLQARGADVTATDQHPEAEAFLRHNAARNQPGEIHFVRAEWGGSDPGESALHEFDLIIGSDLLYEAPQAKLLAEFIGRHAAAACEVVIVDPRRGNTSRFVSRMGDHGFLNTEDTVHALDEPEPFRGRVLRFTRG